MTPLRLDHVQLAIPAHQEPRADEFYVGVLQFTVVDKPVRLAQRGGRWYEQGSLKLHLGVEENFVASAKAHVALVTTEYEALIARLENAGARVRYDHEIDGVERFYTWDPFDNRIEIMRDSDELRLGR